MIYNKENPGTARTASGEYNINKLGMFTCNHDTSSTSETQDKSSSIRAVIEEWVSSKVEVV